MLTSLELDALFHPPPTLETARLVLEPLRSVHASALFPVYSDPAVAEGNTEPPHASVDAVAAHIGMILEGQEARNVLSWALVHKDEGFAVGTASLHGISWSNRRAYVGFTLAARLWRRGLSTEALERVIDFSFSTLRLRKLCAQNTTSNEACHAFLLKLGFEQEGLLRQHAVWDERSHDLRQYGLVAPRAGQG